MRRAGALDGYLRPEKAVWATSKAEFRPRNVSTLSEVTRRRSADRTVESASRPAHDPGEVTRLLKQLDGKSGNDHVVSQLFAIVYRDLHRRASSRMRRPNQTMEATELVNQAFLKLIDQEDVTWQNRAHFFALASTVMRRIVIDRARKHNAEIRGGAYKKVPLDEALVYSDERSEALILLDRALNKLADLDPRQSQVVEMRFFGGLSTKEIAQVLGISENTVYRDWKMAEAWLKMQISDEI